MAVAVGATVLVSAAAPIGPRSQAVTVVGPAHAPAQIGSRPTLSLGTQGDAVRLLQERLRVLGSQLVVDGQFGPVTLRAVQALQSARRLVPDGVVGPLTWQVLDGGGVVVPPVQPAPSGSTPTLRSGLTGPAVVQAQLLLTRAGHPVAADGRFGPATLAAVLAFQRNRRLVADGVVGPVTWAALSGASVAPRPIPVQDSRWVIIGAGSVAIRPGDTLTSVAAATGSTASALSIANRIALGSPLPVGSTIRVPGNWRCPVPGASFYNDYGAPRSGGRTHEGNDMYAPRWTPILAPVGGLAVHGQGVLGGLSVGLYGEDGNRYYLAHMDRQGAAGKVAAGSVLGYVGTTGNAVGTAPHLHFEVHPGGGASVNPYPTLTLACRR